MKERVFSNWNLMRFIRLFIGMWVIVQGIWERESLPIIAGFFLLLTAVLNYGCCGSAGCAVSYSKNQIKKEVEYEEVDAAK